MKKLVALVLAALMSLLSVPTLAYCTQEMMVQHNFVTPAQWAQEAVYALRQNGYIGQECLEPNDERNLGWYRSDIRRDYIVAIMVQMYETAMGSEIVVPDGSTFEKWGFYGCEEAVWKAQSIGLVMGKSAETFGYDSVTRQELAVMLFRLAGLLGQKTEVSDAHLFTDDGQISQWAKTAVEFVTSRKLMMGTSEEEFSPNGFVSREMAYTVMHRFAVGYGIYPKLSDSERSSIEFTPYRETQGDWNELYTVLGDREKELVDSVLTLFGDPYEKQYRLASTSYQDKDSYNSYTDFFAGDMRGDYARVLIRSKYGDCYIHFNPDGIYFGISILYEDFYKYSGVYYTVLNLAYDGNTDYACGLLEKMYQYSLVDVDEEGGYVSLRQEKLVQMSLHADRKYDSIHISIDSLLLG